MTTSESEEWDSAPECNQRGANDHFQYHRCEGKNHPNRLDQYQQYDPRIPHPYENEYGKDQLKMEIPFFSGHMRIEDVLNWLTEVERFFEDMEIPNKTESQTGQSSIQVCSIYVVGTNNNCSSSTATTTYQELAEDEEVNSQEVSPQGLSKGTVHTLPELQTRS